ncbi:hypothetical protein [Lacipirellula parvula]|uniref:Uncharacterized protein n=1 Tax=Lacipirellula parvula TaxID=2650471 RepID=A0A5K7XEP9_9BACT|nr:hypothetical protein [Lacipirellula parvula]BBO35354.1 hypothetical protein PLANPX_4966 [Lacipirellula parvula]
MIRLACLLALLGSAAVVCACGGYGDACPAAGTPEFAQHVAALRLAGPAGLEIALRRLAAAKGDEERAATQRLVDEVAGQRDAEVARLFWYTDLEQAKLAAAESGRRILSLRMLGKLTDEYSCANSRFFRTALYANAEISGYLRDHFILHWESVRPVPRVTVDFGDGRTLERTLTGNSAHYVLDAAGTPLDVLPGLYGPQAFHEWLERSHDLASRYAELSSETGRERVLQEYHTHRELVIAERLRADLAAVAPELLNPPTRSLQPQATSTELPRRHPTAMQAARVAVSKSLVEVKLVAPFAPAGETLAEQDDQFWQAISARHADEAKLDKRSVALMRGKVPREIAEAAMRATFSKRAVENPLLKIVGDFEHSLAVDGVRNEYTLHREIHDWFVNGTAPREVGPLNERVYAELFLTPSSDPWLGLTAGDAYAALDGGGLTEPPAAK